ncbi:MAG: trigger factor [Gammaproteobacteria bacterium]|nr:trigger factor [Gammaproteobacteria bacterium]
MQVAVENKEGLEKVMTISFAATDMNKEIQSRLQSLSKTAKLNGFRPGKVPLQVIKQKFGPQVEAELLNENIQKTFYEAVSQEKIRPAGGPEIDKVETGKDEISYTATFEVFPEVEVGSLSDIEIEMPVVTIETADIDKTIDNIVKQQTHFHDADREVQEGDKVTTDFVGTIEGEAFSGNEGKDVPVVIGSGQMIEGFEQGLIGKKVGETLTLNLKFPDDYQYTEVAGKPVDFEITISKVEAPHTPELNDEFFARFGVNEGGLDAFREEVEKNMSMELERNKQSRVKNDILNKVLEASPFDVPKALITDEARRLAEQMRQQYNIEGQNLENELSLFEEEAKKRVALGLLLAEIIKSNEFKASAEEVKAKVENLASSYESPDELVNYYLNNKERTAEIESLVMEDKVVDWACEQAKTTEKSYAFSDFMQPERG